MSIKQPDDLNHEIIEYQIWFNAFRELYGLKLEVLRRYLANKENPVNVSGLGKCIDTFTFFLPKEPKSEKNSKEILGKQRGDVETFLSYFSEALRIYGYEFLPDERGHPYLDKNGILAHKKISGDKAVEVTVSDTQVFNVYYWRSKSGIGEGKLELVKNESKTVPHDIRTATLTITYPSEEVPMKGDYWEEKGTIYIRLQRKDIHNHFVYSHIIFHKKNGANDICFATFCTASAGQYLPYAGLMILERKEQDNNGSYRSFYESLLYKKRIQPEPESISFGQLSEITKETHALIKRWKAISKIAGIYLGYLLVPVKPSFESCIIQIEQNARVKIWTSMQIDEPYTGVLCLDYEGGYKTKAIIKADKLLPFETEYRVKIYINIKGYNKKIKPENEKCTDANTAKGVYTCFRFGEGEPFASQFAIYKIAKLPDVPFKDGLDAEYEDQVKSDPLNTDSEIEEVTQMLEKNGLINFFTNKSNSKLNFGAFVK